MNKLLFFQNYHQNEPIIVCGCGESLNDFVQPERFITIGVNDVGRKFQPDYLVVVNPKNQFLGDRFKFVETSKAEYLFTQLDLPIKHPNIVKFQLGVFGGTDFSNPNVLNYTNNSPYIALCLAILMGAKRIGVIGVDFTDHHFFARTGKHPLTSQFDSINEQYCRLAEAAKAHGVGIFNLSEISRLTAFPKVSIDEFGNRTRSEFENKNTPESLKIVSYATTPIAGVPAILARCINAQTTQAARCVWATKDYGNGVKFTGDVEWKQKPAEAETLLEDADLIIVHNGKVAPEHEKLLKDKAVLTMAHNYLWNVDERFVRQGFPGVVVGQYQAALAEFKDWTIVPNPIPFWETEYKAENKPDEITICYTPSGKHEKYPPGHQLYWHSKGFETTTRVLEKLSKQFPIKLEVISDGQISHAESLEMKRRSHIVIDECVTGSYHRNSLEGLAFGCVVINGLGILPKVVDVLRICAGENAEIPFVSATLENLEEVLTRLIESGKDSLIQTGLENRIWLEENWSFAHQWQDFWLPEIEKSFEKVDRKMTFSNPENLSKEVGENPKMKRFKNGVSVVIPHGGKKRLPHLRTCLANLRQCENVGEIIVVEMDETSQAAEIARKWADKYVFIRRTDLFERARTLNVGSSFAECEFVLWLDNDLLVPKDFVSRAVSEISAQNLDFLLPFSEIKYLSFADSEKVMQGTLNPDECNPIKIYTNTMTEGGTGIVRKEFLQKFGGIPQEFRGWGGEDNGWTHKVRLLGKVGRTNSRQTVFHLYHALSGGNGGNAHILANPHYQKNWDYLTKIRKISDAESFLNEFPPEKVQLLDGSQKICFVAEKDADDFSLVSNLVQELNDLFGIETEIISANKLKKKLADLKIFQSIVFFDKQKLLKFISAGFYAPFIKKTILFSKDSFSIDQNEESGLQQISTVLIPAENNDAKSLALDLAQTLSLLVNDREIPKEPKKQAAIDNYSADFPVWYYWEGDRPEWIEACYRTILAKAPDVRFLTPETFDELWDSDRDIDISRLYVAHRADFIRTFLLAKFGGLWIDADCIVVRDLRVLLEKLGEYDFIAHRERSGYFSNDLIAAKPKSRIAGKLYENICQTLRKKHSISWLEIGGEPLTEILHNTDAPFYEIDCEKIQPICWSEPEKFFAQGSESEHEFNFDDEAICYMLSNGAVINYQNKNPNADLTAENTFFSFAVRRVLDKNMLEKAENLQILTNGNSANSAGSKNENRWQTLSFYLEMIDKIAPQKVLDADVGSGRWAVLLRDFFESSNGKEMKIEAFVETKPETSEIFRTFYDGVQVGKLEDSLQSVEEKQDLLIFGDYLTRNGNFQNTKMLERALNFSDYILLNLNPEKKEFQNSKSGQNLLQYLTFHPEQVAVFQTTETAVSVLLSQNDPKNLRLQSSLAEVFCKIAENYRRQKEESISGPGSSLRSTAELRRSLPLLFAFLEINSMLDARCGDFNWLKHVELKLEKYIGVDIVPSIIEQDLIQFENENRKFFAADITADFLPKTDLIFCRDCLVHFSFAEIFAALRNFCRSGAKYLLTTTFPKTATNKDIQTGDWRTINFQLPPFNFPAPLKLLNERCPEGNGKFADKSLGLWKISDIYRLIKRQ